MTLNLCLFVYRLAAIQHSNGYVYSVNKVTVTNDLEFTFIDIHICSVKILFSRDVKITSKVFLYVRLYQSSYFTTLKQIRCIKVTVKHCSAVTLIVINIHILCYVEVT